MLSRMLRIGLGLGTLGLLMYVGLLDPRVLGRTLGRVDLLALATLLLALTMPLAAFRWWLLLKALGFPMGYGWSLRTTFTSQFYSTVLPGAYGGDVIRASLAYRAAGSRLSRLTSSILVDRLSGFLGLLILGFSVVPLLPGRYRDAAYPVFALTFGVLLGAVVVGLIVGERVAAVLARVPKLGSRLAHVVREILGAVRGYFNRWPVLAASIGISVVQFVLAVAAVTLLGWAMNFHALSPSSYAVASVWSILANALPVTPGGLGVGEAAFAKAATILESAHSGASYATVFLAHRMLGILIVAAGEMVCWLLRRDGIGVPPLNENAASDQAAR